MALPTIGDAVTRARDDVSDAKVPYRFSDVILMRHGSDGQKEIARQKPSSLYIGDEISVTDPDDIADFTALTENLSISRKYLMALVHWIDYCVLKADSEDASNQKLAAWHWDLFLKEMA